MKQKGKEKKTMATMLETYLRKREEIERCIAVQSAAPDSILLLQELNYRIDVLRTFQAFLKTAPITTDTRQLGYHYQLVNAYSGFLETERKFGASADGEMKKKRDTAAQTLSGVIADHRKRFSCFHATSDDQYRKEITGMINTILPAWVMYRNLYVQI